MGLTVQADALSLQQVFFNLFLNARDALSDGHNGRLKVTSTLDSGLVEIRVTDNAGGIPEDMLPLVFEPLQTSKNEDSGRSRCRGLGLALCRNLVEEMGGQIRVETVAGESSTSVLSLPASS